MLCISEALSSDYFDCSSDTLMVIYLLMTQEIKQKIQQIHLERTRLAY